MSEEPKGDGLFSCVRCGVKYTYEGDVGKPYCDKCRAKDLHKLQKEGCQLSKKAKELVKRYFV